MIKDNKPLFHPTFGSRPAQIVGREDLIQECLRGLAEPIGSRERCRFYTGQRGMGKTALLLELAERAASMDYVVAHVTAYEGMNEDLVETIQRKGAPFIPAPKKTVSGASAGAMGFSFGLTFSEEAKEQFGFRTKMSMLCEALEKQGKGILILVDETKSSEAMRQLAITYQHLVGEERNVAIIMAGLPHAVSDVLNDDVLTFLNRAYKEPLQPIRTSEIRHYYAEAFRRSGVHLTDEAIDHAAASASGFPYLMQLIGYYIVRQGAGEKLKNEKWVDDAISEAVRDLADNVFSPILSPLSDNDLAFLRAMAIDSDASKISEICKRMKKENSYIQPYRARMIAAGIVESPRKGTLVFAVPYLAEYLRHQQ